MSDSKLPGDSTPSVRRVNSAAFEGFTVGIGASAGGLQALEIFLDSLPANPGACFVVVSHLSPDFRSLMVNLLQRRTQLPICQIESGMTLAINQIFVLPPGELVSLQGQQLWLETRGDRELVYPIDHFFVSLAQVQEERSIGILLSGTGRDGTEGLKAISRAGGVALIQAPETAQFSAMPTNALSSGLVDEILSPAELAHAVCDIVCYANAEDTFSDASTPLLSEGQLGQILQVVQSQEDVDFSRYKPGTVHRRIVHRLLLSKAPTLDHYIAYLRQTPDEVSKLHQDLLIGTTRFFRDPDMWSLLQDEILPAILDTLQPEQPLRVWVTACSTGEEAYSLAIAINEVMQLMGKTHPVKLFATDVDEEALAIASQGTYTQSSLQALLPERLEQYFSQEGATYRIKRFIRTQVVFASHDLTKNPGFSHMHLVSCRNLLIYMQPDLQEQVLKLLYFSMTPRGVLILGPSESLGPIAQGFRCLSQPWKLFRKRQDIQLPISRVPHRATPHFPAVVSSMSPKPPPLPSYERLLASALQLRFGDNPVTCVLVNQAYQTLYVLLNTAQLLEFPLGAMQTTVLDIILPSLRLPLRTALHRAIRNQSPVLYNDIQIPSIDPAQRVNLRVALLQGDRPAAEPLLLVLLEVTGVNTSANIPMDADFDPDSDLSQQVRELELELQHTRENLQTSIEELETANEEQQATNEELLASNEELQSTNEELQSVNEELYTVNAENQRRIDQLTELSADIDNLLQSTDIGVVFLDNAFNIRKFTAAAATIFNFRPGDAGRPLTELVNPLDIDNLMALVQTVAQTQIPQETAATHLKTGDRLLLRILPYRREDNTIGGIVLTLVVINDLKQTQAALQQSVEILEAVYQNCPWGLALLDEHLRFLKVSPALAKIDGLSLDAYFGKSIAEVLPDISETVEPYMQQVLMTGQPITNLEIVGTTSADPTDERTWLASYYPVMLQNTRQGVGAIIVDITDQKRRHAASLEGQWQAQANEIDPLQTLWQTTLSSASMTLFIQDVDLRYTWAHNSAPNPHGDNILGLQDADIFCAAEAQMLAAIKQQVLETGESCSREVMLTFQGSMRYYDLTVSAQRDNNGEIIGVAGVCVNITESKQNEAQLRQVTQRLEQAQRIAHIGDWEYDVGQDLLTWSAEVFNIAGLTPQEGIPSIPELLSWVHSADRPLVANLLTRPQRSPNAIDLDIRIYPRGQEVCRHVHMMGRTLYSETGQLVKLYGTVMDITERKTAQEALQHQAFFDALTQLPNRAFFLQHLKLFMGRASRDAHYQFAVLYLDVDNFKEVNDTLGHAAGDQLLQIVAQRLDDVVRPGDIVSRLGGDEFAILLEQTAQAEVAIEIAFRIQTAISTPIALASTHLSTTVSIGIALYSPHDSWESETAILENADIAMYQAKRQGPGNVELFRNRMRTERVDQVELKTGLQQALEQDEFVLHYQPLIHLPSRSLQGFETLVRWQHPQRGMLSPMEFLPIVQASHLMPGLETWILQQACQQFNRWSQQFSLSPAFQLNINISPDFLKHPGFINKLRLSLSQLTVAPEQICLEVTENSFIGYGSAVDSLLRNLKQLGVKIALDDFGTGYSSLSYLHRLPIDVVKIDQSFIQSLGVESSTMGITQGIVNLARQLNLSIIAEGVEILEQLRLIQDFSCDYGQGYLFSHPLPAEEAGQLIAHPHLIENKFQLC